MRAFELRPSSAFEAGFRCAKVIDTDGADGETHLTAGGLCRLCPIVLFLGTVFCFNVHPVKRRSLLARSTTYSLLFSLLRRQTRLSPRMFRARLMNEILHCSTPVLSSARRINHPQVSVMARIKADDKALNGGGGGMSCIKKAMSGHSWREFLKVWPVCRRCGVRYHRTG